MRKIGRPQKVRTIKTGPKITQFSPRGKPGRPDEIELSLDQFEALKLSDLEGLDQSSAAQAMDISRPSFGRILRKARGNVADGLVNGKIIRILGGNVKYKESK